MRGHFERADGVACAAWAPHAAGGGQRAWAQTAGCVVASARGGDAVGTVQALAGLPGRLTRILVEVRPGQEGRVRSELTGLAAGRLTVAPADQDVRLLDEALGPGEQSSLFFAAIAGVLGFLLAFSAFLVTVPERRRAIAELRAAGTRGSAIVQMVLYQGLCLGADSDRGWAGGGLRRFCGRVCADAGISRGWIHVGEQHGPPRRHRCWSRGWEVSWRRAWLVSCRCLHCASTQRSTLGDARAGEVGSALGLGTAVRLTVAAGMLARFGVANSGVAVACAGMDVRRSPSRPAPGVSCSFSGVGSWARRLCRPLASPVRGAAPCSRIAARDDAAFACPRGDGTVALFGAVALGGACGDLVRGIARFQQLLRRSRHWIVTPNDSLLVNTFTLHNGQRRIRARSGVQSVSALQGQLLDVGNWRIWVLARPSSSP